MRILVACEESQAVTIAFRDKGHEAYSCDVQPCSGGHPEWHIKRDVLPLLNGCCCFTTEDGSPVEVWENWDMIIAHPPCTYLSNAGAVRLRPGGVLNEERMQKAVLAKEFFLAIWNSDCPRIAVENPVPGKIHELPPYTQIIEPFWFGDPWKKRTCLWLKGLPALVPTEIVEPLGLWVGATSSRRDKHIYSRYQLASNRDSKIRSKTFPGIAKAIAEQWGGIVISDLSRKDRCYG